MMKFYRVLFIFASLFGAIETANAGEAPITTDSRIKTYVYNENEVYPLVLHYGYESSIEFGLGEEAEVTSIGDSYAWKLNRVGRRIFIKTLEANTHTNLTVITNKHTYQFDLLSKMPDEHLDEELMYVTRFYYPETNRRFDKTALPDSIDLTPPSTTGPISVDALPKNH